MTIGSKFGRLQGRTLQNYCHKEIATAKNRLKQGCPLFETKPDNISQALAHSIDTAEQLRNFKELNLLPALTEMTAYEFTCYDAAERSVRKINDEITKKANKPDKKVELPSGVGDNKPRKTGSRR